MDEQLKDLRKAMNNSLFKQNNFSEHQKAIVRLSVNKKQKFNFVPAIIIILFLTVSSVLGLSYINDKQSAAYLTANHDLEAQLFVNQRNTEHTLFFLKNELTISTNPSYRLTPDSSDLEKSSFEPATQTVYENISVKTDGDQYFVNSGEEHILTLKKIAPRLVEDEDGNVFSTQKYLSDLLAIEVVNESDIKLTSIEILATNEDKFDGKIKSERLSKSPLIAKMEVNRSEFHRVVEFQVNVTLADGTEHTLNDTILLDGAYEDLYLFRIVGSSVEKLRILKK
ncbi:hypothetical protein SAMN05518871_104132 [Psychrobacillus sp. OK028]|uniref:hypothetical protein n=1 Tax=Psychrobacillus sp. OK028 TaxID=1884359 RepID=UPI00088BB721|nr:hypothetical protein [Psychrobacillus sp. OK028]SDN26992.1 hypothetical protein SAMN05518871_104132 [Psychrobacillus sp. OK028]